MYNPLDEDVLGEESDPEEDYWDYDKDKKKKGQNEDSGSDEEQGSKDPSYVFYDFRLGPTKWPDGVEIIDKDKAAELVEKVRQTSTLCGPDIDDLLLLNLTLFR